MEVQYNSPPAPPLWTGFTYTDEGMQGDSCDGTPDLGGACTAGVMEGQGQATCE